MFISPNPTPADNNALRVAERMHPVALSLNDGNRGRDERGDAVREQTVLVAKKNDYDARIGESCIPLLQWE